MNKELKFSKELIEFIDKSPSSFHVVKNIKDRLNKAGYMELNFKDRWTLEKEGKYYVTNNNSAIIAFVVGSGEVEKDGFKLIGSHTDAPGFRIKPNPEMVVENRYLKLNTETYGGPILNSWFDRPLSLAGRIALKGSNPLKPEYRLINIDKDLMIIPNLAIHMNREVNEGVKINKQTDTLPLLSLIDEKFKKDNFLFNLIGDLINEKAENIFDADIFLYGREKGSIVGLNDEFISVGKLDDLAMVHGSIEALLNSKVSKATNVCVCFDNEEVGSTTKQGAASPMLRIALERITMALKKDREDYYRALSNSFLISADMAHGVHPNYSDKHDPTNRPVLNKGPVIKISANQSYTTDSITSAIYEDICRSAKVPVQKFVNRSDARGGSTIGPINTTQLDIPSLDIGNPILGMHSIREIGGVLDHYYGYKSFIEFYNI
ncbi:M18 family aminopeptidase [Tissierella sp. MSJ-40]|uniref:M18 family aminopeptidase n=1 Tax=Tissierella simiarum TaxID=2841534 RepID=A0ABS6E3M1_9FIRM|nr:M18 family aminopeptidase [Tissierella simiarum]MBU5437374.1 M18 family aminopeptidase [Tissierella simiarum]